MSLPFHFYSDNFSALRFCFSAFIFIFLNVRSINIAKFLLEFNPFFGSHQKGATARKRQRTDFGELKMHAGGIETLRGQQMAFDWTGGFR